MWTLLVFQIHSSNKTALLIPHMPPVPEHGSVNCIFTRKQILRWDDTNEKLSACLTGSMSPGGQLEISFCGVHPDHFSFPPRKHSRDHEGADTTSLVVVSTRREISCQDSCRAQQASTPRLCSLLPSFMHLWMMKHMRLPSLNEESLTVLQDNHHKHGSFFTSDLFNDHKKELLEHFSDDGLVGVQSAHW